MKEWHPKKNLALKPINVTPGSNKKVWWQCSKGHEWRETPNHRTGMRTGCPYCSGRRVGEDNNLAFKYPELVKQWHPIKNEQLTPYDVMPGSIKKVWWRCNKGHEWEATPNNRTRGSGCPHCYREHRRINKKRG